MTEYHGFKKAKAIFLAGRHQEANVFAGFFTSVTLTEEQAEDLSLTFAFTGRTYCRLYLNGRLIHHGPGRAGHGHARVDQFPVHGWLRPGENQIAIECASYAEAFFVENDHTCEPGFIMAELFCQGESLCATHEGWQAVELTHRHREAERHSHCRPILESYRLEESFVSWRTGDPENLPLQQCQEVEAPILLERVARLPVLQYENEKQLLGYGSFISDPEKPFLPMFFDSVPEPGACQEEPPSLQCFRIREQPLMAGRIQIGVPNRQGICPISYLPDQMQQDGDGIYFVYDLKALKVGFLHFTLTLEEDAVVDLAYSEQIGAEGEVSPRRGFKTCLRAACKKGRTCFTSFEPYTPRYIKVMIYTKRPFILEDVGVVCWHYPDLQQGSFHCSDEGLNRLYEAARRTLQINTLDLFMDCADRERGGWLCDSLWTARAARMMYGDEQAEKAMLEDFLCVPRERQRYGFFPSCYPANGDFTKDVILTWSFWLLLELSEYCLRTGDWAFAQEYRPRVEELLRGAERLCNQHGLLEPGGFGFVFIDWSLSNEPDYNGPISTAANALYAAALDSMGRLYQEAHWCCRAREIRKTLEGISLDKGGYDPRLMMCDSLEETAEGQLKPRKYFSESAQYTALWSGLFTAQEYAPYREAVVRELGPSPVRRPVKLDVGPANLFIGLCVRLDMLARLGEYSTLLNEIRSLFGEMLDKGPGTFWETVSGQASCCHGFTSHVGVWLQRDILGLGIPEELPSKRITLAPHPCSLDFAQGVVTAGQGIASLKWSRTEERFHLTASAPGEYELQLILPKEIRGCMKILLNGQPIAAGTEIIRGLRSAIELTAE